MRVEGSTCSLQDRASRPNLRDMPRLPECLLQQTQTSLCSSQGRVTGGNTRHDVPFLMKAQPAAHIACG